MNIIHEAVCDGVREGFELAMAGQCSGEQDPERCPMRPESGCTCYWVSYLNLPWWKKLLMQKPARPSQEEVVQQLVQDAVETSVYIRVQDLVKRHYQEQDNAKEEN